MSATGARRSPLLAWGVVIVAAVFGAGLWLVLTGLNSSASQAAPLPADTSVSGAEPTTEPGAEQDDPEPPPAAIAGAKEPTVFIPALDVTLPVVGSATFEPSDYEGSNTLTVPDDPNKGAWYTDAASLVGGDEGTTLVGAHVAYDGEWGALHYLATVKPGDTVWTTDGDDVQQWRVTALRVEKHTDFPQEYWRGDGVRQLVVTTCGGTPNADGRYPDNVFVIATPVGSK